MVWIAVLSAVVLVCVLGAVAQRAGEAADLERYRPDGRFVDVDQRRVHVIVEGTGPLVALVSGLGGSTADWDLVAPQVS